MGHAATYDKKSPSEEKEKLLDVEHHSAIHKDYEYPDELKHTWWQYLRESLPSCREVLRLSLFCAVTVIGMTFISEALSQVRWSTPSTNPKNGQDGFGTRPVDVDLCPSNGDATSLSMDFTDPTKFSLTQLTQEVPGHHSIATYVHTTGQIEVRNAEQATGSYVHVDLKLTASDPSLTSSEALALEKTDSSLTIKTPRRLPGNTVTDQARKAPCLYVSAIVTISPGAKLQNLGISSNTLAVIFHPGLDYAQSRVVDTKTDFGSTSTYSRETIIDVNSASVTGAYPLYDLLSIHTNSGSINADIVPKNASIENVKPAVLRLSSNSGSVRSVISTVNVPDRDYQTTISTSSGSVQVGVLHGLRTSLRSINGRINADLYPYGHNDSRTNIETHCTSGGIDITVHPSLSHPKAPLKKLYGSYYSTSGSLTLFYPAQWQGTVKGTTLSGGINLDWQGLNLVKDGKHGYVKRYIEAVRGEGEGVLEFHETSGSVHLSGERGGL